MALHIESIRNTDFVPYISDNKNRRKSQYDDHAHHVNHVSSFTYVWFERIFFVFLLMTEEIKKTQTIQNGQMDLPLIFG